MSYLWSVFALLFTSYNAFIKGFTGEVEIAITLSMILFCFLSMINENLSAIRRNNDA